MTRSLLLAALLSLPGAAIAGDYAATTASVGANRVITKSASWACTGTACTARTEASRPVVVCQGLAKKVGTIASFTADGRALSAEELAKCNALARASDATTERLAKN